MPLANSSLGFKPERTQHLGAKHPMAHIILRAGAQNRWRMGVDNADIMKHSATRQQLIIHCETTACRNIYCKRHHTLAVIEQQII